MGHTLEKLFRPEVQEARSFAWLGQPVLPPSLPLRVMAAASIVIVGLLCVFLVFGEYTRRVQVQGVVLPTEGLTRIVSPVMGWIRKQRVKEGDAVRQGDVLYTLSLERTTSLGSTQGAMVELLRRQLAALAEDLERQQKIDKAKKQSLRDQEKHLVHEAAQTDAQVTLAQENTETFRNIADRQQAFLSRGLSTSRDYHALLQGYMSQQTQLEMLKRERVQIEAKLSDVRDQLAAFDLLAAAERSRLRQQTIHIEQQIAEGEAEREITVTAPRDGKVTGIITQAGQTVSAGTPLLTILPDGQPLEAQLLAPSSAIGFVQEGDRVLLRYAAFPYQKFGQFPGTVSLISRATLRPEEVSQLLTSGLDDRQVKSVYRITVRPDQNHVLAYGRKEPLQVGMQLEAEVLAETRPLYQWILEPLYGLRGYFTSSGSDPS